MNKKESLIHELTPTSASVNKHGRLHGRRRRKPINGARGRRGEPKVEYDHLSGQALSTRAAQLFYGFFQ